MSEPDFYELLEVSPIASVNVIRAAYRALALKAHRDEDHSKPGVDPMIMLNRAKEILCTASHRHEYDRTRSTAARPWTPEPLEFAPSAEARLLEVEVQLREAKAAHASTLEALRLSNEHVLRLLQRSEQESRETEEHRAMVQAVQLRVRDAEERAEETGADLRQADQRVEALERQVADLRGAGEAVPSTSPTAPDIDKAMREHGFTTEQQRRFWLDHNAQEAADFVSNWEATSPLDERTIGVDCGYVTAFDAAYEVLCGRNAWIHSADPRTGFIYGLGIDGVQIQVQVSRPSELQSAVVIRSDAVHVESVLTRLSKMLKASNVTPVVKLNDLQP